MIKIFKRNWKLLSIFIASFVMFFPSLFKFFTNDDFFFLKIAHISSVKEFLIFFNLIKDTAVIGVYRPLTLRIYYFLGSNVFNLNPLPLHIISFVVFFAIIFLVGKLAKLLTNSDSIALLSSFLYAVSVTHFGQLYYVGAFQELLLTLVFLASVIYFILYEKDVGKERSAGKLVLSFIFFMLSLMCKETAVVLPFCLILVHIYLKLAGMSKVSVKKLIANLIPYFVILGVYLFLHFRYFGLISGDSYVWDFSLVRAVNTFIWYGLWSLNLPEMLIDFIGPGIHLNPNLLKYWSDEIVPIFVLFAIQVLIIISSIIAFVRADKKTNKNKWLLVIFSVLWFTATLLPILFLPVHKFTYYLTLPLIGIVFLLSNLLTVFKSKISILFCAIWIVTSVLSLRLTINTNWIIQGENISERVYQYFSQNKTGFAAKNIVFVDTGEDSSLPWSPTATLKVVLSDKSFFDVFYPSLSDKVNYDGLTETSKFTNAVLIKSRQFLGY